MLHSALKNIRNFNNMSADDLADELGLSKSYISELENGKKRINMDIVDGYSHVFRIPKSSIFLLAEALEAGADGTSPPKSKRVVGRIINWISSEED